MATDTEKAAVQKLAHAAEGESVIFTAQEGVYIRRMIRIMIGADSLIWAGSALKNVLYWAGGMYLAYIAFFDWAMKALGKK